MFNGGYLGSRRVMKELIEVIEKAGQIAIDEQSKMVISVKSDKSIVTNGDIAVSNFLEKELLKLYPEFEIYSEENFAPPSGSKVIVIDPIDGTESYSRKQDTWSILVSFIEDNQIVRGIVYQPTTDLLYYGEKGTDSWVRRDGVIASLHAHGKGALKALRSHKDYGEDEYFAKHKIKKITPMYSAALKIMKVAEGKFDCYANFRKKCSLWDLAAPLIILRGAGGEMDFAKELEINFSNPALPYDFVALGERAKRFTLDKL